MQNLKTVIVGDGTVGKTCLLMCYTQNAFPSEYVPTIFESHTAKVLVDNKPINLQIDDTAGQEDYDQLLPLDYSGTHAVLICFAVNSRDSLDNVKAHWLPIIKKHLPSVPFILVGTKADLRTERKVSEKEGKLIAKKIGAKCYLECSALTMKNVSVVFDNLIRVGIEYKTGKRVTDTRKSCEML